MERNELSYEMLCQIAKYYADDTLDEINAHVEPVKVKDTFYTKYIKRLIDIVLSFIAVVVTLPINAIIGLITVFDVGAPVMFLQKRLGKDCKAFTLFKYRSMNEKKNKYGILLPPEERVTKFGKIIRKTSLDELFNFWSVLKGDMSLIGPRPLRVEYGYRYNKRHICRQYVRPGLECPSISGENNSRTWQGQFENDVWYAENVSFITDCKMFFSLFKMVFNRKQNGSRGSAERTAFMGYDKNGVAITIEGIPQEYIDRVVEEFQENKETANT